MRFRIEELGNLAATADRQAGQFAEASWRAMSSSSNVLKGSVRADIRSSGIRGASKLANAWRLKVFPGSAKAHAAKPVIAIGTSAQKIVETFEKGGAIRFHGWGLVPIGPALRVKVPPGHKRSELPELVRRAYNVTRFISGKLKNGAPALGVYADGPKGRRFLPLFKLVREVNAPKLLKGAQIIEVFARDLPNRHSEETFRLFDLAIANDNARTGSPPRILMAG